MKHYFIYATKENDLERLKQELSAAFSVEFEDHESSWWGTYVLAKNEVRKLKIYPNFVEGEGYHEDNYQDYPFLIEIPEQEEPENISNIMGSLHAKFKLVKHHEI